MIPFGHDAYLADLLRFAQTRVKYDPAPDPSTVQEVAQRLAAAFYQPYEQLYAAFLPHQGAPYPAAAMQPVLQVRVAVEILRRYLGSLNLNTGPADEPYLRAAYELLLLNLGTSWEELRLVRTVGDAQGDQARWSLAQRLGIEPVEQLQALFMETPTEALLESVFGLVKTTRDLRDLFAGDPPQPGLLKWRADSLRKAWQIQDAARQPDGNAPAPAIDPDLIAQTMIVDPTQVDESKFIASDVIPTGARQVVRDLWQARSQQVSQLVVEVSATIEQARQTQPTPLDAFNAVITNYLGVVDLEAVLRARTEGQASPPPAADPLALLDLTALRRLVRIRCLAAAGSVTRSEWDDVTGILVQWQKLRACYSAWLKEEQDSSIHLGPDFFVQPAPNVDVSLPHWRASCKARLGWEDRLRARSQQMRTAVQALQTAIDDTERVALTDLRDGLIRVLAQSPGLNNRDPLLVAEQLTKRLLVDFKNQDGRKTTRIEHAIETLQALLFALRIGRPVDGDLPLNNPAQKWKLNTTSISEAVFDVEWKWMGSHAMRTAVEWVKEYPENYLLPSLRDKEAPKPPSAAFWQLIDNLNSLPRLTPTQAQQLANNGIGPVGSNTSYSGYLAQLRHEVQLPPEIGPSFEIIWQLPNGDYAQRQRLIKQLEDTYNKQLEPFTTDDVPPQQVQIQNPHNAPAWLQEIFYFVPMTIALQLHRAGEYLAALDWYQTVYAYPWPPDPWPSNPWVLGNPPPKSRKIYAGLALEDKFWNRAHVTTEIWLRNKQELNPHFFARRRKFAYSRFTIISIVQCLLDYADSEFTVASEESLPHALTLYRAALELLGLPELAADNPLVEALQLHAQLNLEKLRAGRNIAGMERPVRSEADGQDGTGEIANLPVIGSGGQLVVRLPTALHPTPYRYTVLMERAKQLVSIAQQMESAYLAAMEKRDDKAYNVLRARQDLQLNQATVQLQVQRVDAASMGVTLARLQQDRPQIQSETFQRWIDAGPNEYEQTMIDSYREAGKARQLAAFSDTAAQIGMAFTTAATADFGAVAAGAQALAVSLAAEQRWEAQVRQIAAETSAQVASVRASHEQRRQEWQLQKSLAVKDVEIAGQQISLAVQQKVIAVQERDIASMRADQSQAMVDYLGTQFTNTELYAWMSGILARIYSYFLQQAIATAQLAQNQLAFERQEPPPTFIQSDYWQPTAEGQASSGSNGNAPDRQGLTGSARLLQDIYKLDQYALETNKRKLQLSQTFSLARLFPFEFQQFRSTGVLPFATPMELFDRGFPGHYLRLIKRVRVSVVALVPPAQGIRASLVSSGISRVVVGPDVFQTIEVSRSPELIAFTSPANATGLFELESTGEMLLPFEGMGVDASWQLEMPRAANPFDYRSIADVLVTIEYTALHSFDYRQQVIRRLDPRASGERSISLRNDFPDLWRELCSPDEVDPARQMLITVETRRSEFPPNLEGLVVDHLLLYFTRTDCPEEGPCAEVDVAQVCWKKGKGDWEDVGGARSSGGVISTRRANASQWKVAGKSPIGTWQIHLPNTPEMRDRFKNGGIEDVLFVITYSGHTPPWPA